MPEKYTKIESKLLHKTAAMENKQREKFDATKEKPSVEVMTMGGRLPMLSGATMIRQQASWR
jgi:hypothetical protein